MKSFYLDKDNGDTKLNELHNIREVDGKLELEQAIWMRLKTNRGEWAFDTDFGYPWLELFRSNAQPREFKVALIETMQQEERVIEVLETDIKEIDRGGRKLILYFKALTTEGLIESSGEVGLE